MIFIQSKKLVAAEPAVAADNDPASIETTQWPLQRNEVVVPYINSFWLFVSASG